MVGGTVLLLILVGLVYWLVYDFLAMFFGRCASFFSGMGKRCRLFGGQYADRGATDIPPKAYAGPDTATQKPSVQSELLHLAVDIRQLKDAGFELREFLDAFCRALPPIGIEYKSKTYLECQRDAYVDLVLFIESRSKVVEDEGKSIRCELSYRLWNAGIPQEDKGIIELAYGHLSGCYDLNKAKESEKLASDLVEVLAKHRPAERPKPYALSRS